MDEGTVAEFFRGKNVFLTGATGFIGKVLIEKVLRCCPEVKKIYCLIRPKRGVSHQDRLVRLTELKLFDSLRADTPGFIDKLQAVNGDLLEEDLGLSESDKEMIRNNIQIVFHSGATVKFDEPLRVAMELNVLAVRRVIRVCKPCKQLESFVHVSTAYSNCEREYIEEVVYPPPVEPQKIIDTLDWMTDEMLNTVTPKLLGPKPNTYTYTKHLAESLLLEEAGDMPIAIVRPSIVTAAWKEPLPGWIDSLNGPSGVYVATGKGFLRSMVGDSSALADLVPVDLTVNTMIAVSWYTAKHGVPSEPNIYHITTSNHNPFTWGEMDTMVGKYFKRNPLESCYRRPRSRILTPNNFLHDCWVLVSHLIPAYAADLGYVMMGKSPRVVNIYTKIHRAIGTLEYFTSREWQWTHNNMETLFSKMSQEDQRTFYMDARSINWVDYMESFCLGTKKFVLKEDMAGLPAARAHLKKLRNIRYVFNTFLVVIFWRLLIARSNLARNSWYLVMGLVFKFVQFFRITSTITPTSK